MSFGKTTAPRFHDHKDHAPPVGTYDPRDVKKISNVIIEKSDRFKSCLKDGTSGPGSESAIGDPVYYNTSSKKGSRSQNSFYSSTESMIRKPAVPHNAEQLERIRELEMELRRILREKTEKDKELYALHCEYQKLEGRLSHANIDRTSCLSRCAQLEQEARDARHGLEVLQKQASNKEIVDKRREERFKEELRALEQEIENKEKERHIMQTRLLQAVCLLATEAEGCAKQTDDLGNLFLTLDISLNSDETLESDSAGIVFDTGDVDLDSHMRKVWQLIKKAASRVARLAECGVASVETLQQGRKTSYEEQLDRLSANLMEAQDRQYVLQHQVKQQKDIEDSMHTEVARKQEECQHLENKITQLQKEFEEERKSMKETQSKYTETLQQLDRTTAIELEKKLLDELLQQTKAELGTTQQGLQASQQELEEERKHMTQEREACETRRLEERLKVEESCRQLEEKLCSFRQGMEEREAELVTLLQEDMMEHKATTSALQEGMQLMQERLEAAEHELLQKQVQQEELIMELQRAQEQREWWRQQLEESQGQGARLQQEIEKLQQEIERMREKASNLQLSKEELEAESGELQMSKKELELRSCLLREAIQCLKEDAYGETATGTPVKAKQLLFEETAERAFMEERVTLLEEENKILNTSVHALTKKYKEKVNELEKSLQQEVEQRKVMESKMNTHDEQYEQTVAQLQCTKLLNQELVENLTLFEVEMKQIKSKKKEAEALLTTNQELKCSVLDLETRLEAEVEKAKNSAKTKEEQLSKTISELKVQLEHEKLNLDKAKSESDLRAVELQLVIAELRSSLEELKSKLASAQAEADQKAERQGETIRELQEKLGSEELAAEKAVLESKIERLETELKEARTHLEDEQLAGVKAALEAENNAQKLATEIRQHQMTNKALLCQVKNLQDGFEKERRLLQEKYDSAVAEKAKLVEQHKEDLTSVQKALTLDKQSSSVQVSELEIKLQRMQDYNAQMKEELKKILKENEMLKHESKQVEALQGKLTNAENQTDLLQKELSDSQMELSRCRQQLSKVEEELEQQSLQDKVAKDSQARLQQIESEVELLRKEKTSLEDQLNRVSNEQTVLESDRDRQLHQLREAAYEERVQYERMIGEMSDKIQQLEDKMAAMGRESDDWHHKYVELYSRVEPFIEHLDAYATEKSFLLGRSEMAEAEMAKMMDKYARLLGHQNQKQKIQYINKLKDDYMQCRKEKDVLKEKVTKMQTTIQKLERKLNPPGEKNSQDIPHMLPFSSILKKDSTRSPLKQANK